MPSALRATRAADLEAVRAALAGDYDVVEELGRGGMAVVYRARERGLDRDVAVKVLPAPFASDSEFVERFEREARTAAQLEHPHIVPIYRVGRAGPVVYFVMKLLRGQSLGRLLQECGHLPAGEVRRILAETAGALGYAHRHGVVHRDVKPDNVMLDEDGRCVVTDFGIAKSGADNGLTAAGTSVGTPRYMSPEQARAKPVDGRSDLYSLGVVGYQCLAGVAPFEAEDALAVMLAHVSAPLPHPPLHTAEERRLFAVIERMLAKSPADRFQTAEQVMAALGDRPVRAHRGASYGPPTPMGSLAEPPEGDDPDGEPSGPQPSPTLDAALTAGIGLLRTHRPRIVAAAGAAGRAILRAPARVAWRARRLWIVAAVVSVGSVSGYFAAHFAAQHSSRCPAPTASARGAQRPAKRWSLLVDAPVAERSRGTLDVYYDVCGLDKGAEYTAAIVVRRRESAAKRLLGGGSRSITRRFDERASGPATRRHETIEVGTLAAGSYTLAVHVTDQQGRTRSQLLDFHVR